MQTTEKRTQIYLPIHLYRSALRRAQGRKISLAGLVREALQDYLGRTEDKKENWIKDPLNDLVGFIAKGPKDLSEKVDDFLYPV